MFFHRRCGRRSWLFFPPQPTTSNLGNQQTKKKDLIGELEERHSHENKMSELSVGFADLVEARETRLRTTPRPPRFGFVQHQPRGKEYNFSLSRGFARSSRGVTSKSYLPKSAMFGIDWEWVWADSCGVLGFADFICINFIRFRHRNSWAIWRSQMRTKSVEIWTTFELLWVSLAGFYLAARFLVTNS